MRTFAFGIVCSVSLLLMGCSSANSPLSQKAQPDVPAQEVSVAMKTAEEVLAHVKGLHGKVVMIDMWATW